MSTRRSANSRAAAPAPVAPALRSRAWRRRGLTLIECTVATAVLALAASGAMVAVTAGYQQQRFAQEQAAASAAAQMLLEEVVAKPYRPGLTAAQAASLGAAQGMNNYADEVTATGAVPVAGVAADRFKRTVRVVAGNTAGYGLSANVAVVVIEVVGPSGRKVTVTRLLAAET